MCNSICPGRQWAPEVDRVKLQLLESGALRTLTARDNQALELKYLNYPSVRPIGWQPPMPLLLSDDNDEGNGAFESDSEFMHETQHGFSTLQVQLGLAESKGNPALESLFGTTKCDQVREQTNALQNRKRGRPRKSQKSSSGARNANGSMANQLNGITLTSHAKAPSIAALKAVQQRVGGLVSYDTLLASGAIPGRVQVSLFLAKIYYMMCRYLSTSTN